MRIGCDNKIFHRWEMLQAVVVDNFQPTVFNMEIRNVWRWNFQFHPINIFQIPGDCEKME